MSEGKETRRNILKLPYRPVNIGDMVIPLVLRIGDNVNVAEPIWRVYDDIWGFGVWAYYADTVDLAFLLMRFTNRSYTRDVLDVYRSSRVDNDIYFFMIQLVDMLWVEYGKSHEEIEKTLSGKSRKEIEKMYYAYLPYED